MTVFRRCFELRALLKQVRCVQSSATDCPDILTHTPVMGKEVVDYLNINSGDIIIDMTFGGGGHTKLMLEACPDITVICVDRDPLAIRRANELKKSFPNNIIPCKSKFSELPGILAEYGVKRNSIDRILFDFGCSSMQFDSPERGFSLSSDGPLDMRMDSSEGFTAADVLQYIDEQDLYKILKVYGEEKHSRKIARAIMETRYSFSPIRTTHDLANLVSVVLSDLHRTDKLQRPSHAATKVFQALRIFVNNELNEINYGMLLAAYYLKVGGRLVTLSFHSLEDRIVKRHVTSNLDSDTVPALPLKYSSHMSFNDEDELAKLHDSDWVMLTKHVLTPSEEEVSKNPRSRSAKMRAAVKIK